MADSGNKDSGASLFSSLRSFWAVLVTILYTRLDLATTELEEVGTHAVELVVISLAALVCLAMTAFFFLFFLVVVFWAHAAIILGIVFFICVISSAVLVLLARKWSWNGPSSSRRPWPN